MRLRILFICSFFYIEAISCDVCNVFEYANRQNKHYIGVFYRNRMFNGFATLDHPHKYQLMPSPNARVEHEPESNQNTIFNQTKKDYEYYQTVEIRGNYAISQKVNIQVILPYNWSEVYYNEVTQLISPTRPVIKKDSLYGTSGIGDIVVMSDYIKSFETGNWKHILKPGIGIKLPTGSISKQHLDGNKFHPDLQPGTGSWDFIFRANYLVTNDIVGLDFFSNYRFCTQNSNQYTFGNRFNITAQMYYTFILKKIKILPKIGAYSEYASFDQKSDIKLKNTGGYTHFAQIGLDLIFGKMILQTIFQKPYFEFLNGDVAGNAGRLSVGLIYNFGE